MLTVVGYNFGFIFAGSALIETVFAWPGVGRLLESITRRDYPVMTAILLLVSATVVVVNLITDVLYVKVDPRVQYRGVTVRGECGREACRRSRRAVVALGVLLLTFSLALAAAPGHGLRSPGRERGRPAAPADSRAPGHRPPGAGCVVAARLRGPRLAGGGAPGGLSAPPSWGRPWGRRRRGLAGRGPDALAEFFQTLLAWCWP